MKTGTNMFLFGILSLIIGTAFASPLLISELDIVPFWTMPEGPKADFSIDVAYAHFAIQENASEQVLNGYNLSVLDYYVVLNVTNHSDMPATVSALDVITAKNVTIVPSALGGFYGTHAGGLYSGNFGPTEGYAGHVGAARVEGVWLDGEWINSTWVPEGGLVEIWNSEDIFPPKGLEDIWQPQVYSPENVTSNTRPYTGNSGTHSNNTMYYTFSGTVFTLEGGNYWIEGVPIKEYIVDNEVKSTIIYYNGSWVDVTDRVEIKERPYVSATDTLVYLNTHLNNQLSGPDGPLSGIVYAMSGQGASFTFLADGFDNAWAADESRLILLTGSVDIESCKEPLNTGEITFYTGTANHLKDNMLNGTYVNTYSSGFELKTIHLEITENGYLYNGILANDQIFVTDSSGVEVFIEPRD